MIRTPQWRSEGIWHPGTNIGRGAPFPPRHFLPPSPAIPAPIGCYRPLVRFIQNRRIYGVMHHWACVKFCTKRQWHQSKFILVRVKFYPLEAGDKTSPKPEARRAESMEWGCFLPPPHQLQDMGVRIWGYAVSSSSGFFWCDLRPQKSIQKCLIMCRIYPYQTLNSTNSIDWIIKSEAQNR